MQRRDRITTLIGFVLCALGGLAVITGDYPTAQVHAMVSRVWPVLVFVVAMTVVAELCAKAGVFDVAARFVVQLAGRGPWLLWILLSVMTLAFTVFLSLDTTVVLVTPIAIVMARRIGMNPVPFALTVVWLANTGSMLLPISNLTNLLAASHMGAAHPRDFASLTWLVALVCALVPIALIALVFRRDFTLPSLLPAEQVAGSAPDQSAGSGHGREASKTSNRVFISRGRSLSYAAQALRNRPEMLFAGLVLVALIAALLSGMEVWLPSLVAALVLAIFAAVWKPSWLSIRLIPWPMIALTAGLFLALGAASSMFVEDLVRSIPTSGDSLGSLLTISGVGAVTANAINNLPAYLALEPLAGTQLGFVALLIGVNAGPLITPWASLATLLWYERLVAANARMKWGTYVLLGCIAAPATVIAATLTLWAQS